VAQPGLVPGDEIGGYRLGEVLGAGGLGTVFATAGAGGEALAIKVVANGLDTTIRRRVEREVEALRMLDHPNVLRLVDAGATDAWSYLVMPRLAGTTLRELVVGGPLTPESAALLVMYAAHGVGAIHRAGLTHRDLKPDNVMITDDGRVVIIDLGLALAPDWTRQTTEGAIAGSLPYMSPEQIEGDASPSSDVWALGVTWWELITAQRPFGRARAVEEVAAIIAGGRPAIGDIDRRIGDDAAALLERCLAREARRRPGDGGQLASALAPIAYAGLAGTPPATAVARLRRERSGWEAEVAARLADQAARHAMQLAAGGDVFAAVRALDRGLAYRPDDAALKDALARLMPEGAPTPALSPRATGPGFAVGTPLRPVSADAVAPTEVAGSRPMAATVANGPRPVATAFPSGPGTAPTPSTAPTPAPAPRARRWLVPAIVGAVVAAGATTAIVLATRGDGSGAGGDPARPNAIAPPADDDGVYADTAADFDRFARELVRTVQEGRQADFRRMAAATGLADPAGYFTQVFGAKIGAQLAAEYADGPFGHFERAWPDLRAAVVDEARSTVTTSRHTDPDDETATGYQTIALRNMRQPVALYRLRLARADGDDGLALWSWAHVNGRFRMLGKMKQVEPADPFAPMAHELDVLGELPMNEARKTMNEWKNR
jgi:hypothetical protein